MNKYMQTFFELLPEKQNTSAALGFFDGLHIGHRKVIGEAVRGSVYEVVEDEAKENLKEVLTPDEYESIFDSGKYEIKLKILDIFR